MDATCSLHSAARAAPHCRADFGLAREVHFRPGMDFVALGLAVAFFALSWGFVALCERL